MSLYENYKLTIKKLNEIAEQSSSFKELAEKSGLGKKELQEQLNKFPPLYNMLKNKFKDCVSYFEENTIDFPEGNLIVLDTSVIQARNLFEAIDVTIQAGFKIVLTSITIKELDLKKNELKRSSDERKRNAGLNAQKLLAKAVADEANIIPVEIPEVSLNPDDDIINAIKVNKENITLWSGDNAMLLKARMHKIANVCICKEIELPKSKKMEEEIRKEEPSEQKVETEVQEEQKVQENNEEIQKKGLKAKIQELMDQIEVSEAELQEITEQQDSLKVQQESKEADLDSLKAKLAELQEKRGQILIPMHEPNTTIYKSYMKNNKLYLAGKLNPITTMIEVYDAYGEEKSIKEALELGDLIITVMMREDVSSIKIREEQVAKISESYNAYTIFEKRVYSIDSKDLENELPEKYFKAVMRFFEN